jgi:signal transduction histidine kinase
MTVATDAANARALSSLVLTTPRTLAAAAVVIVSCGTALAAIVLSVLAGRSLAGPNDFTTLYLVDAIAWGVVSGLLISRRSGVVGVLLAVLAIGSGLSALATQLGAGIVDQGLIDHVFSRLWLPGTLALMSFVPLLLTARPLTRRTRVLLAIGAFVSACPLILGAVRQRRGAAPNPLAIDSQVVQDVVQVLAFGCLTAAVLVGAITAGVLVWRWRTGPAEDRRGVGWLALGQCLLVVYLGPSFLGWIPGLNEIIGNSVPFAPFFAVLFMPAAVILAALGQRLWGIDVAVNRAVVSVLLFAALLTAYAFVTIALTASAPVPPLIAGVVGVVALALAFDPARKWVQRRVDALVYGDAADPAQLLRRLGARLPREGGFEDLQALTDALRDTLRLGSLQLRATEEGGPVAQSGLSEAPPVVVPLRSADGVIGEVVARGSGVARVDRPTRQVLERVAGVLAVAVQFAVINREVGEARDRAREVGDEERRMVRRELHGGLAPGLLLAAERLEAARLELGVDAHAAHQQLALVREALAARTAEVRDLARTLLPGALDAGDLGAALRELAARFERAALAIDVEVEPCREGLDPSRQVAVHHLVAEAVLLARRADGPAALRVSVSADDRLVRIRIALDGAVPARDAAAILRSIRDRATELGGRVLGADFRELGVEIPR